MDCYGNTSHENNCKTSPLG